MDSVEAKRIFNDSEFKEIIMGYAREVIEDRMCKNLHTAEGISMKDPLTICEEELEAMQDPLAVRVWRKWIREGKAVLIPRGQMARQADPKK